MKKISAMIMLTMFVSMLQAQNYDADCREMLKMAKDTYLKKGSQVAQRQFDLLCQACNERICSEARAWLREQKNKSRNNNNNNNSSFNEQTFSVKGVEFKMIKVEGGTFSMGATSERTNYDNDEKPVHSVTLLDYYIGETEVTQELWEAVMGSNPSWFKGNNQRPVEDVSWNDCQEFIKELNRLTGKEFRLPTEAEWEYAARGGKYSKDCVYKYSGSNNADEVAWYDSNSGRTTHSVKTKKANKLGLYDMSGNVWEWCNDLYGDYQSNSQTNPTRPSKGGYRVLRGGSWSNFVGYVRVSLRYSNTPDSRHGGLRLAL
ncbi:MAG: formylglycine-generating enzyme family protein [Bacteroidales bacterium]|nr:formylglycine-generating enzyme family protein [Bacteroidales bacterium]